MRLLGGDGERAREIVQTAFLKPWIHQNTLAGMPAERVQATWLYRVTTNLALDCLRQRRCPAHPAPFSRLAAQVSEHALVDGEPAPDEIECVDHLGTLAWSPAAVDPEHAVLLREAEEEALHALTATQRLVLRLSVAGYSSEEVAAFLRAAGSRQGRTSNAVKMQQVRARLRLRETMAQSG